MKIRHLARNGIFTATEPHARIQSIMVFRQVIMTQPEHEIALEDTDRLQGRTALVRNVAAAVALSGAVRSTLGPRGLDKMLVDENGQATVTNDGVTVLETAKVEHPTANLLIAASSSQDRVARDGTTTTVILMAEMLQNALELTRSGIHPSIIARGYEIACSEALQELQNIARAAETEDERHAVVATSLAGKIDSALSDHLTTLALEAASALEDEEGGDDLERLRIKRQLTPGGSALNSELIQGLIVAKTRADSASSAAISGGKIAIIDGAIENRKLDFEAQIEVRSAGALQEFHQRDLEKLQNLVEHLAKQKVNLVIVRDGIADEAIPMLTEAGITAYRRFEREDIERLARMTGARLVRSADRISEEDVGRFSSLSEESIAGVTYTRIEAEEGGAMTALIRGSTPEVREEVSRAFDDALGVAFRLVREPGILPGGGGTQTHLARHLRAYSTTQKGREQLAIEGFADALEVIPRTLAENAGLDPIDEILALSAAQASNGAWIGLDAMSGEKTDMAEAGINDPLFVARQALTGATEAAISVLRIDDVLWSNQGPQTPDWSNQIDDD